MLEILKDLEVEIYIDDVLIVSNDEERTCKNCKTGVKTSCRGRFQIKYKKRHN